MSTKVDMTNQTARLEPALRYLAQHPGVRVSQAAAKLKVKPEDLWAWLEQFNNSKPLLSISRIDAVKLAAATVAAPAASKIVGRVPAAVARVAGKDSARNVPAPAKLDGPTVSLANWLSVNRVPVIDQFASCVVEVTPPLALQWLTLNQGNRNPSKAKIRRFAAAIKRGKWVLNGETIKFSNTGRLLDGQSRLRAIIEADVPAKLEVRGGLPDITQQSMDVGESRKGAHTLEMLGEKYPAVLAPACKLLWQHEQGSLGWSRFGGNMVLENMEIAPLLARHPELKASVGWVMTAGVKVEQLMSSSSASFFHYIFGQANKKARDKFFDGLASGLGLTNTSPVYHLREQCLTMRAEGTHRAKPIDQRAIIIMAWNAFSKGERCTSLVLKRGDPFPKIHGIDDKKAGAA